MTITCDVWVGGLDLQGCRGLQGSEVSSTELGDLEVESDYTVRRAMIKVR